MKQIVLCIAVVLVLAAAACGDMFTKGHIGRAGDPCLPDGTCPYSLTCSAQGICEYDSGYKSDCVQSGDACLRADGRGGLCISDDASALPSCALACDLVGAGCEDGVCYFTGQQFTYACLPPGTKQAGEHCTGVSDCAPGLQCLEKAVTGVVCWRLCDATYPCEGTDECTDTGFGFSVCVPLE